MFQTALLLLKNNNCAKLFWNPCINVPVMARTSSIYDHFINWAWGRGEREGEWGDMDRQTNRPKPICPFNFFEVGGLTMAKCTSYGPDKLNLWSFYHLTFKCNPDLKPMQKMFQTALLLLKDNTCAKLFWNPCINVPVMARTSSIYDHFDLYLTPYDLDLQPTWKMFQMALLLLEDNNCAKLFWNPCINVQVMARTSSIYDHFDLCLTPVTLTFNLPEKMFQMALLLLEDNNCAKLFWNPCINVQIMARTSSIYDHFDLYLTPVILTFNLPEKMFQMALLLLEGNNCAKLFWNPCINVQIMARTSSIYDHFDLLTLKLFWNPCIIVQVMVQTNPDVQTHAHTPNKNYNNYVSLTRKRARQKRWLYNNETSCEI